VLRLSLVAGFFLASVSCGGSAPSRVGPATASGGPSSRIEERSLSDRPPLAIIERQGDPAGALALASLAAGSAETHAAFGELLHQRMVRAGYEAELVTHGLGFELMLLAEGPEGARAAVSQLLRALSQPVVAGESSAATSPGDPRSAPSAIARCSGELSGKRPNGDVAELEQERLATFARDRAALAAVGDRATTSAVADALADGPDWPERGAVRSSLPTQGVTESLRGERAMLSVGLTVGDVDRALRAAVELGDVDRALGVRLAALGSGFKLQRVTATAHAGGACLRIDSDVDASPVPDARRLGFAVQVMTEEAERSLSRPGDGRRLEAAALSATDPRLAARAAAYAAVLGAPGDPTKARLVALTSPEEAPLPPAIDAAVEQARAEAPSLEALVRLEPGQPGVWALLASPCAAASERLDTAGYAALFFTAAATSGADPAVRLEPWVGASGAGIIGFTERAAGESDADAAERLGEALGRASLAPPPATAVASARAELTASLNGEARPLLEGLLDNLAGGHMGALAPRGTASSLQSATREAVLSRQRELLRAPHRLAVLSTTDATDATALTRALGRWLRSPEPPRAAPCSEPPAPARAELGLSRGTVSAEGSYLAFRLSSKVGAEANVLADVLSQPGGLLARAMAEPELVGAARANVFGTSVARALVVQISAFDGREAEALGRVQRLFERLGSDGVLAAPELEAALARLLRARRLAALDPRTRLVQLLEPTVAAPVDSTAVRRLASSLRLESALVARSRAR
jgi:hypothetical protein